MAWFNSLVLNSEAFQLYEELNFKSQVFPDLVEA